MFREHDQFPRSAARSRRTGPAVGVLALGLTLFPSLAAPPALAQTERQVSSDWSLKPDAVPSGGSFRLLFLTTSERDSTSTDIADYNAHVQAAAAAGHEDIREWSADFTVIGSTAAVNARLNTLTRSTDTDAPIYWLSTAATRSAVATGYADFYDSTWGDVSVTKESGETASIGRTSFARTGTTTDGLSSPSWVLGASIAQSWVMGVSRLFDGQGSSLADRSYLALSPIFVVQEGVAPPPPPGGDGGTTPPGGGGGGGGGVPPPDGGDGGGGGTPPPDGGDGGGGSDDGTGEPAPRAAIAVDGECSDGLCRARTGSPVRLEDTSTGQVRYRTWDFGDGSRPLRDQSVRHAWKSPGFYTVTLRVSNGDTESIASRVFLVESSEPAGTCLPDAETLCLHDSRYAVTVDWWTAGSESGSARVVHAGTNDSGLFRFFSVENWEVLIKVLDGCAVNGHVWVFGASTTDLGHAIRVTDTATGVVKIYRNEAGVAAPAITDGTAFPACAHRQALGR